jgi:hypothetical protein
LFAVYLPALLAAAVAASYFYRLAVTGSSNFDDAYMFVRYADNLQRGDGYAWNPGEGATFGCTSIAYTFLVAALRRLLPGVAAGKLLLWTSGLLGLAAFGLLVLAVRAAVSHKVLRSPLWLSLVLGALLLAQSAYAYHAATGMDTMLSLAGNCLLVLVLFTRARKGDRAGLALAALCGYLVFLIRPDNGFYGLLFPALLLGFGFKLGWRRAAFFAAAFLALLALDTWLKILVFGDPLPLSFYAKHALLAAGYAGEWNPVTYLCELVTYLSPFLLLIALTVKRPVLPILAAFAIPLALTLAYYFTVMQVMGFEFRFSFPSLPFVVVPAAICLDRFLAAPEDWTARRRAMGRRALVILPLACLFWISREPSARAYARHVLRPQPRAAAHLPTAAEAPRMEWWNGIRAMADFGAKLPQGTLLAASEHGLVAARNPHLRILDLVGLHDPEIAHHGLRGDYLKRRAPDLIWLPHPDYVGLRRQIFDSATFREDYVFLPAAFSYGLAVRRDRTDLLRMVRAELADLYRRWGPPPEEP